MLFRTDLFDLLDEGRFFLSKDTSRPRDMLGLQSTNKRLRTVWAKLRVRGDGRNPFLLPHPLDHSGSDAPKRGRARINLEKIREIARPLPAIITGDHNSSAIRYPFYDLFTAYMDDAEKASATPFPWTKDGTLCKWDPREQKTPLASTTYGYRVLPVNTYIHINNETFGRSVTPSDHFPIMANITLEAYNPDHKFYVSATAGKGGDGSTSSPFGSLREAVEPHSPRRHRLRVRRRLLGHRRRPRHTPPIVSPYWAATTAASTRSKASRASTARAMYHT